MGPGLSIPSDCGMVGQEMFNRMVLVGDEMPILLDRLLDERLAIIETKSDEGDWWVAQLGYLYLDRGSKESKVLGYYAGGSKNCRRLTIEGKQSFVEAEG